MVNNQKSKRKKNSSNNHGFVGDKSKDTFINEYERIDSFLNGKDIEQDFNNIDDMLDEVYQSF